MASEGKPPAEVDSSSKEEGTAAVLEEKKTRTKKKKMFRFTQQQIDRCIASEEPTLPIEDDNAPLLMENLSEGFLAKLPQHLRDALAKIDADREPAKARMTALQEELRKERQDILDQYYAKGYVEYEVDGEDDEEAAPRVAHPGRRRFRQGLVKRGGSTRKLN